MPILKLLKDGGRPYRLGDSDLFIGRLPECDIQLDSNMVSRRHARVFPKDSAYWVEDLHSGNGTFVNGKRLESPARMQNGDRLKIGPILLRFEDENASESADVEQESTLSLQFTGDDHLQPLIQGTMDHESSLRMLDGNAEKKLRNVIAIARRLAGSTDLTAILPKILDTLFEIFPAADRGCVLLRQMGGAKLVPAAQKQRSQNDDTVRLSQTVLNKVIAEKTGVLSADAASDSAFRMSESISNLSIRSMMCAPLIGMDGEVTGVIHIDTQNPLQQFRTEDLELLLAVAAQAALSYESARLALSHLEKMKQDSEMEIARAVQRALLPTEFPKLEGYEFFAAYESAQAVGGDYYDCFPLPTGQICFAFGDVAGKGVPGALIMSRIASCVRNVMRFAPSFDTAFTAINDHMCSSMVEGRFVTFILGIIDPTTHKLQLCNGGHASPFLRDAAGEITDFDEQAIGLPVGIMADYPYETVEREFPAGTTLVLTTDGVDEAMSPTGDLYSRNRAIEFVQAGPAAAEALTLALLRDVRRHASGRPQNDDITIMAIRRVANL